MSRQTRIEKKIIKVSRKLRLLQARHIALEMLAEREAEILKEKAVHKIRIEKLRVGVEERTPQEEEKARVDALLKHIAIG